MSALLLEPTIEEEVASRLEETSLTPAERSGLLAYLAGLEERWGHTLAEVVLYGSAARGEERQESDVDLLVVLNSEPTRAETDQIQSLASAVDRDFGIALSPLVMSPDTYRWHREGAPLWHNIRRDGVWLRGAPSPTLYELPGGKPLDQKRREMIAIYLDHSEQCLQSAQVLLDTRLEMRAIPECYYAVFYAASAILLSKGIERRRHEGVGSALGESFVRTGELPAEMTKLFRQLHEERLAADYRMTYTPGEDVAEQRFEQAKHFVQTIRDYLKERDFVDG
ncbi:MAG: HEPN domain-containing protein [Chloroflexi bacterium]|nr:HEPN domain-containing protein [Chloroflexota bacterium]